MTSRPQGPVGNPDPRGHIDDSTLMHMKAEHIKKQADAALKAGNLREAYTKYTECLEIKPDEFGNDKIYANRSLAYSKALRYEEALKDADKAIECNSMWAKAHWRRGEALGFLKRYPESLKSFHKGWMLEPENKEFSKRIWWSIERHTREQIAEGIIDMLQDLETKGLIDPATHETVARSEMIEGLFKQIYIWHLDKPHPGDYYKYYLKYVKEGMAPGYAYMERSHMYAGANCYLQARVDAQLAVNFWEKVRETDHDLLAYRLPRCLMDQPGTTRPFKWLQLNPLGLAYYRLGEAFEAERDHPDNTWVEATKAYTRAVDLDHENTDYQGHLGDAGSFLSNKQMASVLSEIYNEAGKNLENPILCGIVDKPDGQQSLWRCEGMIRFPEAVPRLFSAKARDLLRGSIAAAVGVTKLKVMIDKVRPPNLVKKDGLPPSLEVHFQVQVGVEKELAEAFVEKFRKSPLDVIGGTALTEGRKMGPIEVETAEVKIVDITPIIQKANEEEEEVEEEEESSSDEDEDTWYKKNNMLIPARPKMDLELPYRSYKLVYTNGQPVERTDKHPFCMSRVYYDNKERPKEVWAEMSDGTCAWRQSGDEVALMCLKVPKGAVRSDLEVTVEMRYIKVANRRSGEVYLQGKLFREIIPEDSVWTTGDGTRDEGFMMYLKKMNLELYQKHWQHNRMWWQQLFEHHAQIVWDDYDKDYSDLPAPILQEHFLNEARRDKERHLEHFEKESRERLSDRNDMRRRKRQERLNELRGNQKQDWVLMDRLRPAVDEMRGGVPGGRDR